MTAKRQQRILIVEDNADIQEFARTLLEGAGFAVDACGTAAEGLEMFRKHRPDLAVIDIGLPDGSGLQVCRAVREESQGKVPVIFTTARGELNTRLQCFENGAQDYMQKPFAVQELLARIKVHLDLKKSHDELAEKAYGLELANRARQDLMDMIVHDLKTPLASIKGTLELVQARGLITNEDYKILLGYAGTAADFMLLMLNDLLDIGLAQQRGLKVDVAPVEVPALFEKLATLFAGRYRRLNVKLVPAIGPNAAIVPTDFNLVFRVLVNFLSNAMSVSLQNGQVDLGCARRDGVARFSVADRGPGVPDEDKQAIFEKYKSGRARRDGLAESGSGIGLSFCKLAAEAMKGRVWVEDRPGGGSVFSLEVPVA